MSQNLWYLLNCLYKHFELLSVVTWFEYSSSTVWKTLVKFYDPRLFLLSSIFLRLVCLKWHKLTFTWFRVSASANIIFNFLFCSWILLCRDLRNSDFFFDLFFKVSSVHQKSTNMLPRSSQYKINLYMSYMFDFNPAQTSTYLALLCPGLSLPCPILPLPAPAVTNSVLSCPTLPRF